MESGRDSELIGAAGRTPSPLSSIRPVAPFESEKEVAAERCNNQQQQQDNAIVVMGKQNGEDLDQDAQERMLKEDSTAKIAIEKNENDEKDEKATEVRISS